MYTIVFTKTALSDLPKLKSAKLDRKANKLIDIIRDNPFQYPLAFEKLQLDLEGKYSR